MEFGTGEPHAMTQEDQEKVMELLDYAPWATWGGAPNSVPASELRKAVKPNSDAMTKAQECLDASKATIIQVENLFKQIQKESIMTSPEAGSIPSIIKSAMKAANEFDKDHMKPIAAAIYDIDGTNQVTVKDVKEMLHSAAKDMAGLTTSFMEAKALVHKFKNESRKKQRE